MAEVKKQLEGEPKTGQLKNQTGDLVRLNLGARRYNLEEVAGTLRMNDDLLDYIANKCVDEILGDHG